jgi:RNA polymerase sigma factor (sigma-70 family)
MRISIAPLAKNIEESLLIQKLRSGDKAAFEYLYDHYSAAVYGVIFRIVKKEPVAEEVLQDVFMKVWQKFSAYDEKKGRLFTWIINVARNQAIDRTRSKETTKDLRTRGIENLVSKIDSKGYTEQQVETIGVLDLLKDLPEDQRFVIDQLYLKGYSQSEVADEFNIPLGTVKTRLRLAMKYLRSTLDIS